MANAARIEQDLLDKSESAANWPIRFIAAFVFLNGLFAILGILFVRFPERLESLLPVDYEYYGRLFGLFTGFLLIYFSGRLLARKRLAWWIALVGSLILVFDHAIFSRNIATLILPAVSLTMLAVYADEFRVKSEIASVKQGIKLLGLSIAIAIAYGTIGFARMAPHDFAPAHKITIWEGAVRTVREFVLIGNTDITPTTRQAVWFLASLDIFGALSIAFAFLSLFRPLAYRFGTLPHERSRARELLKKYGRSSEDAFKLWPDDKSYFFVDQSFIAYRVERGVALALGVPIGDPEHWAHAVREFREYCHIHGWVVAFVYVDGASAEKLEERGFRSLKIGEDATVKTQPFVSLVASNKHFRAVRNKFKRLGFTFEVVQPPVASALITQAARVSRSWLSAGGRAERGFGMGYFDHDYLERSVMYVLRDAAGKMVAFANGIESYDPGQQTIDLMRHTRGAETGTMDFLLMCIIEFLAVKGVPEFSLGLAPLSGVTGSERTTEERVVHYLSRLGLGGFSFEGLRKFKEKFKPEWAPVYLMYERGAVGLAQTAVAIGEVMGRR